MKQIQMKTVLASLALLSTHLMAANAALPLILMSEGNSRETNAISMTTLVGNDPSPVKSVGRKARKTMMANWAKRLTEANRQDYARYQDINLIISQLNDGANGKMRSRDEVALIEKAEKAWTYLQQCRRLCNKLRNADNELAATDYPGKPSLSKTLREVRSGLRKDTASASLNELNGLLDSAMTAYRANRPSEWVTIENGNLWKTADGQTVQAHAPGFLRVNDIWYMVGEDRSKPFNPDVNLYSTTDLCHWKLERKIIENGVTSTELGRTRMIERPKLIYNEKTDRYIVWCHWESSNYGASEAASFFCDSVNGPYQLAWSGRPMGIKSRDCNVFQDKDGKAYFISTTEENTNLGVFTLSDDGLTAVDHHSCFEGQRREAPAVVRVGDRYFMLNSACSGWDPNQCKMSHSADVTQGWSPLTDIGDGIAYDTQAAAILTIAGTKDTTYLYVGDRWQDPNLPNSKTIIFPITFDGTSCDFTYRQRFDINFVTGEWRETPATDERIMKAGWRVVSTEGGTSPEEHDAAKAIDEDPSTFWLSSSGESETRHSLTVDLGSTCHITGFNCLPRTDQGWPEGLIRGYEFYAGTDTAHMQRVAKGRWLLYGGDMTCTPCDARYVRLVVPKARMASLAELNLIIDDKQAAKTHRPAMGWSTWNTYRAKISDALIRKQADALVAKHLDACGYRYVNIDDGFFAGRDSKGNLQIDAKRFPQGLKPVIDYIHNKGLKAGIYTDAGHNTCASYYDNEPGGVGCGIYEHEPQDCQLYFDSLKFDFIKVDFCGGDGKQNSERLDLNEKERYTQISKALRATGRDIYYNVCRWNYPGTWVHDIADSWRVTHDISCSWKSVADIINQSLYLSAYAGGGHYNDMDMLEVGRGLTPEEDQTHFALWCMMSSPLMIGCDLNAINKQTLRLLSNRDLIALDQDTLGLQAYVAKKTKEGYVLVKDVEQLHGLTRAVALYNPTDKAQTLSFRFADVNLGDTVQAKDLITGKVTSQNGGMTVSVPSHGTRVYLLRANRRLMRNLYEAETAYLGLYQELYNNQSQGTAVYQANDNCSGGMVASWLGGRKDNDLQWRDVFVDHEGDYEMTLSAVCGEDRGLCCDVNGVTVARLTCNSGSWSKPAPFVVTVHLKAGSNVIRLYNPNDWMPDTDCMRLAPKNGTATAQH